MVPYSSRRPSVTPPSSFRQPLFSLAKLTVSMGTKYVENCKERSPETVEECIKLTKHVDCQGSLWQLSIVIVFSLARTLLSHCPILISRGFLTLVSNTFLFLKNTFSMIYLNSFVRDHRGSKSEIPVTFRRTQGLTKKEMKQENTLGSEVGSDFV